MGEQLWTVEIERAHQAMKSCETSHDSAPEHAVFTRTVQGGEL